MATKPNHTVLRASRVHLIVAAAALLITPSSIFEGAVQAETLRVESDTKLSLKLVTPLNTATARIGNIVWLRLHSDVSVDGRLAIPSGTRVKGRISLIDRMQRPEIQIQLQEILLADGRSLGLSAATLAFDGVRSSTSSKGTIVQNMAGAVLNSVIRGVKTGGKWIALGASLAGIAALKPSPPTPSEIELPEGWPFETILERNLDISDPEQLPPTPIDTAPAPVPAAPGPDSKTVSPIPAAPDGKLELRKNADTHC